MFRKLVLLLAVVAALTAPAPALAADAVTAGPSVVAFNNVTLAASRTSSALVVNGWGTAKLQVRFTYNACTRITFLFEESDDGTTWSRMTKVSSDDVATVFQPYWDTGSASGNVTLMIDVVGVTNLRVTMTAAGGTATDYVTAYLRPARGE